MQDIIYGYLESSYDKCQLCMEELEHNCWPEVETLKARLIEKYGAEKMKIGMNTNRKTCRSCQECSSCWTAAKIVFENIRSQAYSTSLLEASEAVPDTLKHYHENKEETGEHCEVED